MSFQEIFSPRIEEILQQIEGLKDRLQPAIPLTFRTVQRKNIQGFFSGDTLEVVTNQSIVTARNKFNDRLNREITELRKNISEIKIDESLFEKITITPITTSPIETNGEDSPILQEILEAITQPPQSQTIIQTPVTGESDNSLRNLLLIGGAILLLI